MKNKLLILFIVTFLSISAFGFLNVSATQYYGDWQYYVTDDGEVTISDYYGEAKFLVIPQTLAGYPVTGISAYAFYLGEYTFSTVIIPDSVKEIGNYAFSTCQNLKSIVMGNGVETIGKEAFSSTGLTEVTFSKNLKVILEEAFVGSNITKITLPSSMEIIWDNAFGKSLEYVYYNGTKEDYDEIIIKPNNENLTNAEKIYFAYITAISKEGDVLFEKTQNIGEIVDVSEITEKEGWSAQLYTDKECTETFKRNTPISGNITLYVDFIRINYLEISGPQSVNIGEKDIIEKVTFSTDKSIKYLSCTIKFSEKLELSEINESEFSVTEDFRETVSGFTYVYLTCIYKQNENMSANTLLEPFKMIFNVSENAQTDEELLVCIEDVIIVGKEAYTINSIENTTLKVNPVLANMIIINGADVIDKPTLYTVTVLPENTTNKEFEWSVSNETIATLSSEGILTPIKKGYVTIRATAKDGSGVYAEKPITVKVYGYVSDISSNIGVWDKDFSVTEKEYTIYVPKTASSMKLTASHDGTLKNADETIEFFSNLPKTIPLSLDETILELKYTCEGYNNSEYMIKIIKYEGTKTNISEDGKTFIVKFIGIETGYKLILALYDGERLSEIQNATYNGSELTFTTNKPYTKVKVMIWSDLTVLKPFCMTENVKI